MKPQLAGNSSTLDPTTFGRGCHPSFLASNESTGPATMYFHLRKEVRCILPYWLPAMGAIVGVWLIRSSMGSLLRLMIPPTMTVLTLMVGAASFGSEFQCRTMPLLLLQPLERAVLWRLKMIVLAVALLSLDLAEHLMPANLYPNAYHFPLARLGSDIFFIGMLPWLTLVAQDGLIGAALAFTVAGVMEIVAKTLFDEYPFYFWTFEFIISTVLGIVGWHFGRRAFMRWEASPPWRPRFKWLQLAIARPMALAQVEQQSTLGAVVRKEFRLQTVSILFVAFFCLGFAVIVSIVHVLPERKPMLTHFVQFYCLALPVLAGAVSVAGERQLGLLEWHLSLPVSVVRQFLVKMSVCLTLGLGAGFLLPYALLRVRGPLPGWFPAPIIFLLILVDVTIGICASSLQAGTMRAAIMGWVSSVVVIFAAVWLHNDVIRRNVSTWFYSGHLFCICFTAYTVMALALAALFRLAFGRYCKSLTVRRPMWIVPVIVMLIGTLLAAGLLVYHLARPDDVL